MARIYRIYTQDYPNLADLTEKHFPDGFTIYHGDGGWKGGRERNATIEIVSFTEASLTVAKLVDEIKTTNKQEAVLMVELELDAAELY